MSFTKRALDYSVEMMPGWLGISLEFTEICAMRKALLATVSSAEFIIMTLNSKLSKLESLGEDLCSTENTFSLSSYPSTCIQQKIRNVQGIILFQNDKDIHNQIIK